VNAQLRLRFVLASNEIPRLPDSSGALAGRFHILSMPNSWSGKEDRGLRAKLLAELPGILRWAAIGWVRLRQQGTFTQNAAAEHYRRELVDLSSPVKAFVRERCRLGPENQVEVQVLYRGWKDWNEEKSREVGSEQIFGRDLHAAFPRVQVCQRRVGQSRVRVYRGIELRQPSDWGDPELDEVSRDGTRSDPTDALQTGSPTEREKYVGPDRVPSCDGSEYEEGVIE
jgi:putative DNA primase/helicase